MLAFKSVQYHWKETHRVQIYWKKVLWVQCNYMIRIPVNFMFFAVETQQWIQFYGTSVMNSLFYWMESQWIWCFNSVESQWIQCFIDWDFLRIQCYSIESDWNIELNESQLNVIERKLTSSKLLKECFLNWMLLTGIQVFSMLWNGIPMNSEPKCFQCYLMGSQWIIGMASKWFRCFLEGNPSVFNVILWDLTELLEWHPNEFNVVLNRIPVF